MTLSDRLAAVFEKVFSMEREEFSEKLVPEDVLRWDSLGHMSMVSELEDQFGVQFDVDDVMEMTSAGKILEILRAKGIKEGD
jgi:acyl carrier protein